MTAKNKAKPAEKRIPLLEWASAGVGLLILAVMFVLLAIEGFKSRDSLPPLLVVEQTGLTAYPNHYVVEVRVRNESRQTGAGVEIEGVISRGGQPVETSGATVDYVPGKSERRAGLIFTSDPRNYRLETRVTGYERP